MDRSLQWDIFCKVIDNFGDIGVAWRLAADLAGRGHRVCLWVDDAAALAWMAPGGSEHVQVLPWAAPLDLAPARLALQPADVLVECFGCDAAPEFIAAYTLAACANGMKPIWINLEYLSAEAYVARCHTLPSLQRGGPADGWTKWFFYPGFTESTGGLLREPGLADRHAGFDRSAWLAAQGIQTTDETLVSLFCYEPALLAGLLTQLARCGLNGRPVRLLVAAGLPASAVKAAFIDKISSLRNTSGRELLSISYLPFLSQTQFDHLLWACDFNFVRGEDSLVRAIWAGKPFVWHIYPQDDQAHLDKLDAFMDMLEAPASLRHFHALWNRRTSSSRVQPFAQIDLPAWLACALGARARLMRQSDLATQLIGFVAKKR